MNDILIIVGGYTAFRIGIYLLNVAFYGDWKYLTRNHQLDGQGAE